LEELIYMIPETIKLKQILEYFELNAIDYVLVGEDSTKLKSCIDGDIDIVVSNRKIRTICSIVIDLCKFLDLRCVQLLQHELTAYYFVLTWQEHNTWYYLKLDICSDYMCNSKCMIKAEELLDRKIKDESTGFYIPYPANNFIYYLIKKINKCSISEEQFSYLCSNREYCTDCELDSLKVFWSEEQSEKIISILRENDLTAFQNNISSLRDSLNKTIRASFFNVLKEQRRLIKRILKPTGLWLAIYGPDGCGKSSVIEKLQPILLPAFRRTQTIHFRPRLGSSPSYTSEPVLDPHASKPRNPLSSILKLGYYGADYIVGYFVKVLPAKICSTLFIFDRYYDDIIIDQKRYCYGGPIFLLKWLRFFIPKPDLIFCLDAAPEILQARKAEVSFEECKRQREAYKELVLKLKNGYVIDSSQALNQVVNDVQSIILEHMNNKIEQQIGQSK